MKNFKITQSITDRQDASLSIYFKDVSKQSLISPEEEVELARRIKQGDQEALNKLVTANLRFVISVAKSYQNKGLSLVDLIQEGSLGILKAAQRYDETKGYKFISYAVWWIRQSIIHAISDQCRTVRIPMSQVVCMNKINKASEKFEQEHGRKPSVEELEEETHLDFSTINLTLESINRTVSLESYFGEDENNCLLDIIPNENCDEADKYSTNDNIKKSIENVLSKLPFRERDIIRMSFGIGMSPMQNEEIANRFGIGCERVRQLQKEALTTLREKYGDLLKELL